MHAGDDAHDTPLVSLLDNGGQLVAATSAQVQTALAAPREQLGVQLHGRPRESAHRDETKWARRWHINLHPISAAARAAEKTTTWRRTR